MPKPAVPPSACLVSAVSPSALLVGAVPPSAFLVAAVPPSAPPGGAVSPSVPLARAVSPSVPMFGAGVIVLLLLLAGLAPGAGAQPLEELIQLLDVPDVFVQYDAMERIGAMGPPPRRRFRRWSRFWTTRIRRCAPTLCGRWA